MNKNIKNIIIVAIIVVGGGVGYLMLFGGSSSDSNSSLSVSSGISSENIDSQIANDTAFLATLLGLSGIKIDSQLFFSKTFSSLSDNTVEIVNNGTIGRENPFAPLDEDTTSVDPNTDTITNIPPVTTIIPDTKTSTSKVITPVTKKN